MGRKAIEFKDIEVLITQSDGDKCMTIVFLPRELLNRIFPCFILSGIYFIKAKRLETFIFNRIAFFSGQAANFKARQFNPEHVEDL